MEVEQKKRIHKIHKVRCNDDIGANMDSIE